MKIVKGVIMKNRWNVKEILGKIWKSAIINVGMHEIHRKQKVCVKSVLESTVCE